jgi:putative salt-induced outer membrane protein YdiY
MRAFGVVLAVASLVPAVCAQESTQKAQTAAEMLSALRDRGVVLPDGMVINEDGSVVLPSQEPVADAAAAVPAEGAAAVAATQAAAEPLSEPAEPEPPVAEPEAGKPAPKWKQRAEFAYTLNEGNTESSSLRGAYRTQRETDHDQLTIRSVYNRQTEREETTEHRFNVQVNYDRDIAESRWLWFANGRYDWDEFQSWEHRVGGTGGFGYRLIRRDTMQLILRAGAGGVREFGSSRNEFIPEGLAGVDFNWDISERQGIESTFRYFPELAEWGEFRTETTAGWRYALDMKDGLDLTAGLLHEYESEVDEGVEQSDLRLFVGVGLDF